MPASAAAISPLTWPPRESRRSRRRPSRRRADPTASCEPARGARRRDARPRARRPTVDSASTVGRPRESHTPAAVDRRRCVMSASSRRVPAVPGVADQRRAVARRAADQRAAPRGARGPCPVSSVTYSTGDLPSTRARNRPGSRRAARASIAARGSQFDAGEIGRGERIEAGEIALAPLRPPQAFQQHMVEAEGEVEGRVAVPGAFGVEQDRARADRTRMFFGLRSPWTSASLVRAVVSASSYSRAAQSG